MIQYPKTITKKEDFNVGDVVWMRFGPWREKQIVTGPFRLYALYVSPHNVIASLVHDTEIWDFYTEETDCEHCCIDYLFHEKPEEIAANPKK